MEYSSFNSVSVGKYMFLYPSPLDIPLSTFYNAHSGVSFFVVPYLVLFLAVNVCLPIFLVTKNDTDLTWHQQVLMPCLQGDISAFYVSNLARSFPYSMPHILLESWNSPLRRWRHIVQLYHIHHLHRLP